MTSTGIAALPRDLGVVERVRASLDSAPFDALVGLSVDAAQYLSGYWFPYARNRGLRQNIVIWPKGGDPVLLCGLDQIPGPARDSWIHDIRPYAERGRRPPGVIVELLAATLTDLGLERATVGLELLFTPVAFFRALERLVPQATFIAADGFVDDLRMVKTPKEIDVITTCAHAAEQGLMAAFREAKPGWTERRLAGEIRIQILQRGVDDVPTILCGAGDGAKGYLTATDDIIPDGALVRVDLNAIQGGYYADMGRMAVMGAPSPAQETCYAAQLELNGSVISAIRPGVPADSVFAHGVATAGAMGLELLDQPFIGLGHATGVNNSDFPKLNANDATLLESAMVLNVEPDTYGPEREIVHVEEMVLVGIEATTTITATENWSQLPRLGDR